MEKPNAPSFERNREPILKVLQTTFAQHHRVLEIGSGTGQHAVYFGRHLRHLTWYTSDVAANHAGIRAWLAEENLPNVKAPALLDVAGTWPALEVDAVFTANTFHIMAWPLVARTIAQVGSLLPVEGAFCIYGPFNYGGTYTAPSNAQFDLWLKERDPNSAIRHFETILEEAAKARLSLITDYEMPSNNRLLHFQKKA